MSERVTDEQLAKWREQAYYDALDDYMPVFDALESERARADTAEAQIDAVRKLHVPTDGEWCCEREECPPCNSGGAHVGLICDLCTDHSLSEMSRVAVWPCETARILDGGGEL